MTYNWQQKDWPDFRYDLQVIEDLLDSFAERTGYISGMIKALPEKSHIQAILEMMVAEAIKTSEIEGEYLSRQDVMSSLKNNLGINKVAEKIKDKRANGAAKLMISIRENFADPLTKETLFLWHTMVMEGNERIRIGKWRIHEDPMQVVSGALGKEKIHFEAPPSSRVPIEMKNFIGWFNDTAPGMKRQIKKAPLRSAIAHLYFETIHPFEDGNGRIGRAISEKALSQGIGRPILLSLSQAIETNKKDYYDALKRGQRSNEITPWIQYFVKTVLEAQTQAEEQIEFTLKKAKFFDRNKSLLNERQEKVIRRMLEEGPGGFEGGMNARKYVSLTQVSKPTATRDLQKLVEQGIFVPVGGGRSTRYEIVL